MPLGIPEAMEQEHQELHEELRNLIKIPGEVGRAAKHVAEVLHPHFERENELALPVVGVIRELAEGKASTDFPKAIELSQKFRAEYEAMLREHGEIVKALEQLEKTGKKARRPAAVDFVRKLKLHAKTEEDLTYPAVLMAAKLLQPT